jgi:hypothetical protein
MIVLRSALVWDGTWFVVWIVHGSNTETDISVTSSCDKLCFACMSLVRSTDVLLLCSCENTLA